MPRLGLPLSVARFGQRGIELASLLVLLESSELAFYTRRGATFSALRNAPARSWTWCSARTARS